MGAYEKDKSSSEMEDKPGNKDQTIQENLQAKKKG